MTIKKDDFECCICLEDFSDNNNLLVKIPCTCKLLFLQILLGMCSYCFNKDDEIYD